MAGIMDCISQKILDAKVVGRPFSFFEMSDFIPQEYYRSFISALPSLDLYKPLMHKKTLKNGSPTRFELSLALEEGAMGLRSIFAEGEVAIDIVEALCSEKFKSLLLGKFESDLDVTPYPHLYKDLAGFNLPPHTDIAEKAITFGWYLPENDKHKESGLRLFVESDGKLKEFKKILYRPNVAFAFLRSNNSWHGATHDPVVAYERNSLFVTFYRRGHCKDGTLLVNDPNVDREGVKRHEY